MKRRTLIKSVLAAFGINILWGCGGSDKNKAEDNKQEEIFPQSIASGDPTPTGITLWTRLNPGYVNDLRVKYQISTDRDFNNILKEGFEDINTEGNYTVKVFVKKWGLKDDDYNVLLFVPLYINL
jgi:alkaline phosphatase D